MSEPDLGAIISAAQTYGDAREALGRSEAEAAAQVKLDALQAEFDAYRASHPDQPEPEPEPVDCAPLIGMSAPADHWAEYKRQVEATGGKLQARRIFFDPLNEDPRPKLKDCVAEGLVPVMSFKWSPYSWNQVASGAADASMRTNAARIKEVLGDRPCYIAHHHEPDKQSDPKTQGEGGLGADFGRATARTVDLLRPLLPSAKFGTIMNGWWWSAQARGFSDAEIEVWLPKAVRDKLDFIGADHYNVDSTTGENATDRLKRHVASLQRLAFEGFIVVGETNGYYPQHILDVFNYAKAEPMFEGGAVCVWNSANPLDKSGLLDEFQAVLKAW